MINTTKMLLILTSLFLLISCGSQQQKEAFSEQSSAYKTQSASDNTGETQTTQTNRKLIKTGELRFETKNASAARQNIVKLIEKYEGYLSVDNVTGFDDRVEYELEVRIPAKSFDAFLNDLTSGLKHIEHQDISVIDITGKYVDLEARLKSKKTLEKRYLKLLDKANKVEDMLRIEGEIEKARSDIESMQSRLMVLKKSVAFSKLQISFYELKNQTNSIGRKAGKSFVKGWNMLIEVLVGLLNIWPFLIIIGLVLYFILRYDKKIKGKSEAQQKEQ